MQFDYFEDDSVLRYKFTAFLEVTIRKAKIDYVRIYVRKQSREATVGAILESDCNCMDMDLLSSMRFEEKGFDDAALDRAFAALPDRMRKVLTCIYLYRMSAGEIALVYGYQKSYVYKLKQEALKRLRTSIGAIQEGGGDDG